MKQLFQNLQTGSTELVDCPYPQCKSKGLIIKTHASLISIGTERMLVEFSKSGIIEKARQQPEKVKQVLDKIKTDGMFTTMNAVKNKLDEPLPLGYCNAGTVVEVGNEVTEFSIGDRVISNSPHAEIVSVSKNLTSKIPDRITFEEAAFTVAGSIGLQGIRLLSPALGETIVVIGLGLIGQLTAQLAKANGCRVIAFDLDMVKVELAQQFGIEACKTSDPVEVVQLLTNRVGADCVIITASSESEVIVSQAARMSRKRGRIVLVGVVPLNINRSDFYEKELSFQVSCSYGPGRYDPVYELACHDYPLPFVRWTEQRNFEAILKCLENNSLNVKPLITERVSFENAPSVFDNLTHSKSIATILVYTSNPIEQKKTISVTQNKEITVKNNNGLLAIIGSGNFTKMALLPVLKKIGAPVRYICSQTGTGTPHLSKKFGIQNCTTDLDIILNDKDIQSVIITTPHKSHTELCLKALKCNKHVFVEKPLAINRGQINELFDYFNTNSNGEASLTVGFNRRYSILVDYAKEVLGSPSTLVNMVFTMNAGNIPKNHWVQAVDEGGRIIGEACHCIDLFEYIAASPIVSVCASALGSDTDITSDNVSILLKCRNGSQAVINYYSNGSKQYPKEIIEIFSNNGVIKIDNFRKIEFFGFKKKNRTLLIMDKGHKKQFQTYVDFLHGKKPLKSSLKEHFNVTEASIAAVESLTTKRWMDLTCIW
jgi:predicted dehydrogenase